MNTINKNNPNIWTLKSNDKEEKIKEKTPNYCAQYEAVGLSFKNLWWGKKKSNLCLIHIPKPKFTVVLGRRMWHIYD